MAEIIPIARIESDFREKFGVPRQAGLVPELTARIVFEPEFRNPDSLRGIDDFSHLWLIWQFSHNVREGRSPMARPPRLGGNRALGVWATRAPFRPNALGLSCVALLAVERGGSRGPELVVGGADLVDGTPIFDIKPYVAADSHPEADFGFTKMNSDYRLEVLIPDALAAKIPAEKLPALRGVLAEDPRPQYQHDPERIYGVAFAGMNVRFTVEAKQLRVVEVAGID